MTSNSATSNESLLDTVIQKHITEKIRQHKLPSEFLSVVNRYYLPLADKIIAQANNDLSGTQRTKPLFLGLQGTQGSGKSTCAAFLKLLFEESYQQKTLVVSIDDFYLTAKERQILANNIHSLFITRGVPGTHDIALLQETLNACADLDARPFSVPTFDKASDDRAQSKDWQVVNEPIDIIILEGWCVGLTAQDDDHLIKPVNKLEQEEDEKRVWRGYINEQLAGSYADLYSQLDYLIALQAPSFECVHNWRMLQEEKLKQRLIESGEDLVTKKVMSPEQIKRFISHYERLTCHALSTMPKQADWLLMLEANHGFSDLISNEKYI